MPSKDLKSGMKNDGSDGSSPKKLMWSLLPIDAIKEVIKVLMRGAEQYAPNNWELVDNARERYYNAMMRHITEWYMGERNDAQWGFNHLAHAACCCLFLLALDIRGVFDARK